MSIENPFNKHPTEKEDDYIKGDNFIMSKKDTPSESSPSLNDTSVEFKPNETNKEKIKAKEEAHKKEIESTKDFNKTNEAEDMLNHILKHKNPYSETFKILSNGMFDKISRKDGKPVYLGSADTPSELYQIAAEIEGRDPEYKFSFETDAEGKWFKYSVLKTNSKK